MRGARIALSIPPVLDWKIAMAQNDYRSLDPALYSPETELGAGPSAVSWSAIWAGAAVAMGVTLILFALGSGFGLAAASPWPGVGPKPSTFAIAAGIWLIIMQWVSSLFGGYVAGRMRTRWNTLHTDEVFFRDTAHGLLTWAVATIAVAGLAVLSTSFAAAAAPPTDIAMSPEAADAARKAAATFSIFTGISMLIGAFIGCVAAAIGGHLRDQHP
jgi:hypothetical protein